MTRSTSSSVSPPEPDPNVLENRWLHVVMVFFQSLEQQPIGLFVVLLAAILGGVFALWRWLSPDSAAFATAILAAALVFDFGLLRFLPRRGVSFGPVAPQLLVLFIPRLVTAIFAAAVAFFQPALGLALVLILQGAGALAYGWGMLVEPDRLGLTQITVTSADLPAGSPPVRLLHLSDLHLERLARREESLLALIKSTRPDLIVITGDYLNLSYNHDPQAIAQVRSLLSKIHAPLGVYATLGSPPVDLRETAVAHFANSHIQLLRHNVVELDLGQNRRLALLGLDCTHDLHYDGHQFRELMGQKNGASPAVLLYHSPELMPLVQQYPVDLYLCGHTHGGQVRVPGFGAILTSAATGKRYEMGRYDENGTTLYVSRGIGLEGLSAPRIRLFCPPEVILVTLSSDGN